MFYYKIHNTNLIKPKRKILNTIFKYISSYIKIPQNWTLNLIFLDDLSIKNLNKTYREKNKITDVLSFHYFDDFSNLDKNDIAWEIVFCENKIISQGIKYNLWTEKEFYKLLIHSMLHILWYDHIKEKDYKIMNEYENQIWLEIFEK